MRLVGNHLLVKISSWKQFEKLNSRGLESWSKFLKNDYMHFSIVVFYIRHMVVGCPDGLWSVGKEGHRQIPKLPEHFNKNKNIAMY